MTDSATYTVADLARVQLTMAKMTGWDNILDEPWFTNPAFLRALLKSMDDGWTPSIAATNNLMLNKDARTVVADVWDLATVFDDDTMFANPKFAVLTAYWVLMGVDGKQAAFNRITFAKSLAQLRRMFAVGRVDVTYMRSLAAVYTMDTTNDFALLLAHDPEFEETLDKAMDWDASMREVNDEGEDHKVIATALAETLAVREHLFQQVWLGAHLSAAEHAEVREMQPQILRELYPQAWTDGYAGYVRALAVKA